MQITSRFGRRLVAFGLSLSLACTAIPFAGAVTKEDINALKNKRSEVQSQMSDVQDQIDSLQGKINSALEQAELYQQQMGLISDQINDTQSIIDDYTAQIEQTQLDLAAAQKKEQQYYELFCERFRDLEEAGSISYLSILFEAASFSDLLDRLNFVKDVAQYDNGVVDALEAARQEVADTEARLEDEKAGQEAALADLQSQQDELQAASDKNDALIAEVRANQAVYQDQLSQLDAQNDELDDEIAVSEAQYQAQLEELRRQAEAAERKRKEQEAAAAAANNNKSDSSTKSDSNTGNGGSGKKEDTSVVSGSGAEVASYACQFIGNPYVWGGTSLTNGADCSGFVMQVYKHFGVSLSHSSYAQRSAGRGVSYSEAQPGDIIFYYSGASASGGHIGIYIGGGQMVSARGAAYGIGVTSVNPNKSGFTVRRLLG